MKDIAKVMKILLRKEKKNTIFALYLAFTNIYASALGRPCFIGTYKKVPIFVANSQIITYLCGK